MIWFLFSPQTTTAYKALVVGSPAGVAEEAVMAYLGCHDRGLRDGATGYAMDERKRLTSACERGMLQAALEIPRSYWGASE